MRTLWLNTIRRGWSYRRVVIVSFVVLGLGWACAAEPQLLPWPEQVDLLRAQAVQHAPDALLH